MRRGSRSSTTRALGDRRVAGHRVHDLAVLVRGVDERVDDRARTPRRDRRRRRRGRRTARTSMPSAASSSTAGWRRCARSARTPTRARRARPAGVGRRRPDRARRRRGPARLRLARWQRRAGARAAGRRAHAELLRVPRAVLGSTCTSRACGPPCCTRRVAALGEPVASTSLRQRCLRRASSVAAALSVARRDTCRAERRCVRLGSSGRRRHLRRRACFARASRSGPAATMSRGERADRALRASSRPAAARPARRLGKGCRRTR